MELMHGNKVKYKYFGEEGEVLNSGNARQPFLLYEHYLLNIHLDYLDCLGAPFSYIVPSKQWSICTTKREN